MLHFVHFNFNVLEYFYKTHHIFWLGSHFSVPFHLKLLSVYLSPLPVVFLAVISSNILKFSGFHNFRYSSYVVQDITPSRKVYTLIPKFRNKVLSPAPTCTESGHNEGEDNTSSRNIRINLLPYTVLIPTSPLFRLSCFI